MTRRARTAVAVAVLAGALCVGAGAAAPAGAACVPPPNDPLSGFYITQSLRGTNDRVITCATTQSGEPQHGGFLPISTVWFRYRNQAGHPTQVELTTQGSDVDTRLSAYYSTAPNSPTFASLIAKGSNDDASASVTWSKLVVNVLGGLQLFVVVDRAGLPAPGEARARLTWQYSHAPFASREALVAAFYRDFQGVTPTQQDINGYVGRMDQESAEDVALAIADFRSANTRYNEPIARLYRAYFARRTDGAGLRYWRDQMRAGKSLSAVSQFFSKSSEFTTTYGALTNAQFVDLVYQNVLGRAATASDRSYWTGRLNTGYKRYTLMNFFSESAENKGDTVAIIGTDVIGALTGTSFGGNPARRAPFDPQTLLNTVLMSSAYRS